MPASRSEWFVEPRTEQRHGRAYLTADALSLHRARADLDRWCTNTLWQESSDSVALGG